MDGDQVTIHRSWTSGEWDSSSLRRVLPALPLIALPLLLCIPILFGGRVLYWGVYLLQFYPWRQLTVEQIRAGHWPLWNPYLGAGTPLAANLQTAAFYPPNVLYLLMPVERAFGWDLALHVALAGIFAFTLGRTLGLRPFGAVVTGLTYGAGGYVIAHWVFPTMVSAAAWLPLMLALTERLVSARSQSAQAGPRGGFRRGKYVALLALATGLQLLAGHAQTSFYSLLIVAAFALVRGSRMAPGAGPGTQRPILNAGRTVLRFTLHTLRRTWPVAPAVLWAVALAAIQLLPTAELAAHSQRAGPLTDLQFAFELSFWPWRLITLLAPDFFGNPLHGEYWAYGTYWEEAAFVGVLPLMLAGLAVARGWRGRCRLAAGSRQPPAGTTCEPIPTLTLVPFFGLLCVISLLLAMGDHTPFYPFVFRTVPGFSLFQAPARLTIGYALGIAVLAGVGAELAGDVRIGPRARRGLLLLAVLGAGVAVAGGFARLALAALPGSFGSSILRLGVTLVLAAALLGVRRLRVRRGLWQGLVVAFIGADLLLFGWRLIPTGGPEVYRGPVAVAEFLKSQPPGRVLVAEPYAQEVYDRYVSLRSFGPSDAESLRGLRESLYPNLNAVHHLPGADNYDPLTVGTYDELWERLAGGQGTAALLAGGEGRALLNLLGVRYIISDEALPLPVIYDAGPRVYLNEAALPEAFVVTRARVVEDQDARLAALLDPAFDPRSEVLLSRPPSSPVAEGAGGVGDESQAMPSVLREGPDRVIIRVETAQPGYLVLTDIYYPGWQVTIDGQASEILRGDHAFRAVALEAGGHSVVFEYTPPAFRLGAWITLGASLLPAASTVIRAVRRSAA